MQYFIITTFFNFKDIQAQNGANSIVPDAVEPDVMDPALQNSLPQSPSALVSGADDLKTADTKTIQDSMKQMAMMNEIQKDDSYDRLLQEIVEEYLVKAMEQGMASDMKDTYNTSNIND